MTFSRVIKNSVRNAGANLTKEHVRLVSKVAFALVKASTAVDNVVRTAKASSHTIRSAEEDITAMVSILTKNRVCHNDGRRQFSKFSFVDPRRQSLKKIEEGWLRKFLAKSKDCFLCDEEVTQRHAVECDDLVWF